MFSIFCFDSSSDRQCSKELKYKTKSSTSLHISFCFNSLLKIQLILSGSGLNLLDIENQVTLH
ncbi:MAG: hypothetical protein Q8M44_04960, partial [bacterium]|nr:hypothetical protein [bacterium]